MLVYLFELDSVRNSEAEIRLGQQSLYEELVKNGSTVVLTFNQLTDSEAFLHLIRESEARTYESVLELFRLGALRVSLYGGKRTASQYVQDAIEKCLAANTDAFLFSGLPVRCTETVLLRQLLQALRYSDLKLLRELAGAARGPERARMEYLCRFARLILTISTSALAGNPPKAADPAAPSLSDYLHRCEAILTAAPDPADFGGALPDALAILSGLEREIAAEGERCGQPGIVNNRSNLVNRLRSHPASDAARLAEAITDLCYNYTLESSISGVSPHYDPADPDSFAGDFLRRLRLYWRDHQNGVHAFQKEDSTAVPSDGSSKLRWDTAVRLRRQNLRAAPPAGAVPPVYESGIAAQRSSWSRRTFLSSVREIGLVFLYVALFLLVQWGLDQLEDLAVGAMTDFRLGAVLRSVLDILGFGILGSAVSACFHLPDILDSLRSFAGTLKILLCFLKTPGGIAYRRLERS